MAKRFEGKRVFITGASSGIGAALALEFARQGARVVLAARREDRLEEVRRRVRAAGGEALVAACDVRNRASIEAAVAKTVQAFGGMDVAIANAGFEVGGVFQRLDTEDHRRQFDTNYFGVVDTAYAVLPHLLVSKGQLGLVSSVLGRIGTPLSSPYCASKFAVTGLAQSLFHELATKGVAVTCIQPGVVVSEIRSVDNQGRFHPRHKDPAAAWLVVSADKAARDIVRALHKRRFNAVITGHGKALVWINRHFPWIVAFMLRRSARRKADPTRRRRPPEAQ